MWLTPPCIVDSQGLTQAAGQRDEALIRRARHGDLALMKIAQQAVRQPR
jgi:hypothetical protein